MKERYRGWGKRESENVKKLLENARESAYMKKGNLRNQGNDLLEI